MTPRARRADHRIPRWPADAVPDARRTLRCAVFPAVLGLAALAPPPALDAQEGTITYTHSIRLDVELPPGMAELKAKMPSALTSTMVLHFSPTGSLMTETGDGPARAGAGSRTIVLSSSGVASEMPLDITMATMAKSLSGKIFTEGPPMAGAGDMSALHGVYENYEDGTRIEAREFLGRTFRVMDERKSLEWRMTTEQAMHLGYPVMKATAEQDGTVVDAWFTPQIPVGGGPASYGGLPGMILLLSIDGGKIQYQASEVEVKELEAGLISAPDEGREVTREEFDRIVADKMEEIMRTSPVRRIGTIGG